MEQQEEASPLSGLLTSPSLRDRETSSLSLSPSPLPPQESMDFYQAKLFSGCVILLLTPKAPVKPLRVSLGPVLPDRAPMEPRLHLHLTVHWIQESFDSREADRGWNYEQRHSTISFS